MPYLISFFLCLCLSLFGKENPRPNIIFILTDDQRWDALGVAGNSIIKTPQMDELAKKLGIKSNTMTAGKLKAAGNPWKTMSKEEREHSWQKQM